MGVTTATWSGESMGGTLNVAIRCSTGTQAAAQRDARRVHGRVNAWADRLTRFKRESDLSRLNASRARRTRVGPTLGSVLDWAYTSELRSDGIVRASMLQERLAAEFQPAGQDQPASDRRWRLEPSYRGRLVVREPDVRLDLDGLAKGWIADRAAALLGSWSSVAVDADGDIAISAGPRDEWLIDVADPRATGVSLATLRVRGGSEWSTRFGVATSGTSVHRWSHGAGRPRHHLIDPRTGRPAETDVVQATVVAPSAREAEVIAKAAVILGSRAALDYLAKSAALAAILLLESAEVACLPGIDRWLA